MRIQWHVASVVVGLLLLITGLNQASSEEFYKGKTVQLVVGAPPGGGYDAYTRAIARHLGKHIPGNPTMLVINKPGAATLLAANYVSRKSKPDGLTLGIWNSGMVLREALGDRAVQVDHTKVGWVGAPSTETLICAFMGFSGIRSFDDVLKSEKPIKMGATRAGSNTVDLPNILNKTLGTRFEIISGYPGTARIRLAMQSREVDGFCSGWEAVRSTARGMLNAEGDDKLIPVIVDKHWDDPEVKDLPLFSDVFKERAGGEALAIYKAYLAPMQFMRPLAVPAGTPKDRLAILRKGFTETMSDPEFLADAKKSKLELTSVPGDKVEAYVEEIFSMSPESKKSLEFLVRKNK